MNPRAWWAIAGLVVAGVCIVVVGQVIAPSGQKIDQEPTDAQLLAAIDPKASTDFPVLRARVKVEQKINLLGQPIWVEFQIINTSDRPIMLKVPYEPDLGEQPDQRHLVDGLPLEHIFTYKKLATEGGPRRALVINTAADPIGSLDDDVTYEAKGPIAPIVLRPHAIIGRRVDLAALYPSMRTKGDFYIQWRPYGDALRSPSEEIRIMAEEQAVLETSMGDIRLAFNYDKAPNHVANFLDLARGGFYDGVKFHRVIEGFMIQGGDPLTADESKKAQWGTGRGPRTLKQEFNNTPHVPGVLSAARGPDVNSASCQFFIVTQQSPHLDGKYTAFGRVVDNDSLKVAQAISRVQRDQKDCPLEPVVIKKVRVEPVAETPTTQPES